MSEENVEILRRSYEEFQAAVARDDPGSWFDSGGVCGDFEWSLDPRYPPFEGREVWRGRDGFVEFVRIWTEGFEEWSIRVERLIDAGNDRVVALTRQTAIGKGSGVPVELYVGQVWELEDGRVARVTNYMTQSDALQAAGLSE
jgi:ketosteroid isomerase-like protein